MQERDYLLGRQSLIWRVPAKSGEGGVNAIYIEREIPQGRCLFWRELRP